MEPRELKAAMQECEWIFDFFAIGFDYLNGRIFTEEILDRVAEFSNAKLRQKIVDYDGRIPPAVYESLSISDKQWSKIEDADLEDEDFWFKLLSILWQIDRAAAELNYFSKNPGRRVWPKVRLHLQASGLRLNRGNRVVTIRPPHLETKRWWQTAIKANWSIVPRGQRLDPLFKNLVRVAEVLGAKLILSSQLPWIYDRLGPENDTLVVGVAPLLNDIRIKKGGAELLPGPLCIVPRDVFLPSGEPYHTFMVEIDSNGHRTMTQLETRASAATQLACEKGVEILVFPELVVPDAVVRAISKVLQENTVRGAHTPRLTVAGSFGRPHASKYYNEAIILDGSGGELYRQRKMHAYKMFPYEQEKYDLTELFQKVPRREDFSISPRQLTFFDSRAAGYRIVVLICEDAAQPDPGRQATAAWHATMVIVPVMSGALEERSWCWDAANFFADNAGALTIVSNSGGLAKGQYRKKGRIADPPLGILGSPLADPIYKNVRNGADATGSGLILLRIP